MSPLIDRKSGKRAVPIETVDAGSMAAAEARLDTAQRKWLQSTGFRPKPGALAVLPGSVPGEIALVLVGVDRHNPMAALGGLPFRLPEGIYELSSDGGVFTEREHIELAILGWALGAYRFDRYRSYERKAAQLVVTPAAIRALQPLIDATAEVRDMVNTPTEDMGPEQLSQAIHEHAKAHKATVQEWVGDDLIKHNFPTIHAVGRASHRAPRLIELTWGKASSPKLVIVGKGVCFDTGGLDIKPADGMRWMKKDMGGAAHAIALAGLVMKAKLPVRLTLLVPAVENAIAGNAMRPGEVIRTRAGHTVEVDNTDAEGRLVLCDALAYAVEQSPDLIVDFATLTGAARVALGPELPALFTNRDPLADHVISSAERVHDPLWRLPLWRPYRRMLESYVADFANAGPSRHAGAITAALYLERFVPDSQNWMHLDTYAWNDGDRPAHPRGGEAQGLRAFFRFLSERYS
ncbi:leucyl aminopeptidase family protein [Luteibacter yeojuensis]|uniref:Leucyl aminopeptidase family protein n=1 Tax=Luteibacter yeojuensis TaxID=345309 RepID=A0A7X5QXP6_9GAMM|nr:leucyl aminopeptidase family protein [Luteibacter yeojuensis]NID17256.1 leucyl aminopeptidase family protein [Luteibacter yeojuensis]